MDKAKIAELAKEYDELQKKQSPQMMKKIDNTTVLLLYILSFIIPLAGFIVGANYASKDEVHYKQVGKNCLIISVINVVFGFIMVALLFS